MPAEAIDYTRVRYVVYDATYFHKDGCLLNLMNGIDRRIIAHLYVKKESFLAAYPWFSALKQRGLNPSFITSDGERSILRAMRLVWPQSRLQRCLYHLQREGCRWLRTSPKSEAGRELRKLLSHLCWIRTITERDTFLTDYATWLRQYGDFIRSRVAGSIAHKDLRRTVVLINNALPDMFYYLEDPNIHSTTNALENFHSRLKADYWRHRGLSKEHRIAYIDWYCYFQNQT